MIYVVMGMHKSGTTLVANLLHRSGINMIDEEMSETYDHGYFYERSSTLSLNKDILGMQSDEILSFLPPEKLELKPEQRTRMQNLIQHYNDNYEDWGFKDPRTSLTYELWASCLPKHRLVIIFRPVDEIWHRYRYGGIRSRYKNPARAVKLVQRWCEHNVRIIQFLQCAKVDFIVLSYSRLMRADNELKRLEQFLGRQVIDARRPELYRGYSNNSTLVQRAKRIVTKQTGLDHDALLAQLDNLTK